MVGTGNTDRRAAMAAKKKAAKKKVAKKKAAKKK
jgi:hypothetical protein